jgi:hypothetical protein
MVETTGTCDPLTPRDWQRSRVRSPAQANKGPRVRHRLAGEAGLLYFSAVHVTTDHFVSLVRHVAPEAGPRADVLAFDVPSYQVCTATQRLARATLDVKTQWRCCQALKTMPCAF